MRAGSRSLSRGAADDAALQEKASSTLMSTNAMPAGPKKIKALGKAISWALGLNEPVGIRIMKSRTPFSDDEDIASVLLFDRAFETSDLCGNDLEKINLTLMDLNLSLYLAQTPEMVGFVACLRHYFITKYAQALSPRCDDESTLAAAFLGSMNPDFLKWIPFGATFSKGVSFHYYLAAPNEDRNVFARQPVLWQPGGYISVRAEDFHGKVERLHEPFGLFSGQLRAASQAAEALHRVRAKYPARIRLAGPPIMSFNL